MLRMTTTSMLNRGVYSMAEAARLAGLPASRVQRWRLRHAADPAPASLSFADLMQLVHASDAAHGHQRGALERDATGAVVCWWPMGRQADVVVDPCRRFGAPISACAGIPTTILASAFRGERSYARVAAWFNVELHAVRDAVRFERLLRSRTGLRAAPARATLELDVLTEQ